MHNLDYLNPNIKNAEYKDNKSKDKKNKYNKNNNKENIKEEKISDDNGNINIEEVDEWFYFTFLNFKNVNIKIIP